MIKKLSVFLLSVMLIFVLSACSSNEKADENVSSDIVLQDAEEQTQLSPNENNREAKESILVVYFSATGTTENIAHTVAELLESDIYEIIPEQAYTADDLAYYTDSRADREQNDANVRPAISGVIDDFNKYDTIILGYPIWHGQAPRIVSTFLESYDFSDKTIIPFCTSHSSGLGSSDRNLYRLCPDNTKWFAGTAFYAGTTEREISDWLERIFA